jgi:adenosine deaminase
MKAMSTMLDFPKVVLHEHLDGNLRPETLLQLSQARGVPLPAATAQGLAQWIYTQANSGSLERYVASFALTVAAMASEEACERVAFEAVEDAAADGAVLAEFRMAPHLVEPYATTGGGAQAALAAMLSGLARGRAATGLACGMIVCGMRTDTPHAVLRNAQLAAQHQHAGVIGFDLAGAERGFPATDHAHAIALAREAGLGITLHAGEADAGERVIEAIALGATRIGHGVQIAVGPGAAQRMARAREAKVHFEVCPTSNMHTGAWPSVANHPVRDMLAHGLSVSIQADNRLVSQVTQATELQRAHDEAGLSWAQLLQGMREAAQASFLPPADIAAALLKINAWTDTSLA